MMKKILGSIPTGHSLIPVFCAVLYSVIFIMCLCFPAISGSAKTLLGTPKQEMLLQMAQECLEKYNFCGIHMNPEAGQPVNTEVADETGQTVPEPRTGTQTGPETEEEDLLSMFDYEPLFVPEQYIMVGDSRFVGMEEAVGGAGCTWICELSAGLSWFADTAVPEIDAAVADKTAITINMGVNDLGNVMGYADVLNQKVPEWMAKGAVVYYMSVNPIESHDTITNEDIVEFNNILYNNMPQEMGWIETNKYLRENGYSTFDGVHFDGATYQSIFNYSMEVIAGFSEQVI